MMNQRVGKHRADAREPRRDRRREPRAAAHQHDRPINSGQNGALGAGWRGDPVDRRLVRDHQRKGLLLARLTPPELGNGAFVEGVADQVESADSLQSDDTALLQGRGDIGDRMAEARPAGGASGGLGVETTARDVAVVSCARFAKRKSGHRGLRPIVWQAARDRGARTAMGAGDERIEMKPARPIEEVVEAGVAGFGVGNDASPQGAGNASADLEALAAFDRQRRQIDPVDAGKRWTFALKVFDESVGRRPFDLNQDAVAVVQHETSQSVARGESIDERAEADTLHGVLDTDLEPLRRLEPPLLRKRLSQSHGPESGRALSRPAS